MNRSILLVAVIWAAVSVASALKGLAISDAWIVSSGRIEMSTQALALWSVGSFLFFFFVSFLQRSATPSFGVMIVVWALDRIFGEHSVSPFERLLRLELLFAVGITIYGLAALTASFGAALGPTGQLMGAISIAGGTGLFASFALSVKYRPTTW